MPFSLAADAVVVIHFGWILFLGGGWIIGRYVPWVKWLHIGSLGYSVPLQLFSWICPLTLVETWLRQGPLEVTPAATFIQEYLEPIVYLEVTRGRLFFVTGLVILMSALAYTRPRRLRPVR